MGIGYGIGRGPGRRPRPRPPSPARCSRRRSRAPAASCSTSPAAATSACSRSTRRPRSSTASPTPTPTSSSAPSSTTRWATRSGSPSSPPASTAGTTGRGRRGRPAARPRAATSSASDDDDSTADDDDFDVPVVPRSSATAQADHPSDPARPTGSPTAATATCAIGRPADRARGQRDGRSSTCRGPGCARCTAPMWSWSTEPGAAAPAARPTPRSPRCPARPSPCTPPTACRWCSPATGVVGVAHAGWRGLAAGVVERHRGGHARRLGRAATSGPSSGRASGPSATSSGPATSTPVAAALGDERAGRTAAGAPALDLTAAATAALGPVGRRRDRRRRVVHRVRRPLVLAPGPG